MNQPNIYGGIGGGGGGAGGQGGAGGAGQGPTTNFGGLQFIVQGSQPDVQPLLTAGSTGDGSQTAQPSSNPAPTTSIPSAPHDSSETQPSRVGYSRSETYCRHLLQQHRGFPLFAPEPDHLPLECQAAGISIGDVGQVTPEGIFYVFFNVFLPRNHPVNVNAPPDFAPLSGYNDYGVIPVNFPPGDQVSGVSATDSVNEATEFPGGDFAFSCIGPDGAILCLPHGSRMERLRNVESIRRYVAANAESWYQHVNGTLGSRLANGELYVLTGCEKTRSWGIATYHGLSAQDRFPVSFRAVGSNGSYLWQAPGCYRKQANGTTANQTVFIHGLKLFLAERPWQLLFGVEVKDLADPSHFGRPFIPYSSRGASLLRNLFLNIFGGGKGTGQGPALQVGDGFVTEASPISKIWHPSEAIHSAIVGKIPDTVSVILIHDDNWGKILQTDAFGKTGQAWEEAILQSHDIIFDNGTAFLERKPTSTAETAAAVGASTSISDWLSPSDDDLYHASLIPSRNLSSGSGGESSADSSLSSVLQSPPKIGAELDDHIQDILVPSSQSCSAVTLHPVLPTPFPTPGLYGDFPRPNVLRRRRSDGDLWQSEIHRENFRSGSTRDEEVANALQPQVHYPYAKDVVTDSVEIPHPSLASFKFSHSAARPPHVRQRSEERGITSQMLPVQRHRSVSDSGSAGVDFMFFAT